MPHSVKLVPVRSRRPPAETSPRRVHPRHQDARTWEHDLTTLRIAGFAELYRSGVQYDSPAGRL